MTDSKFKKVDLAKSKREKIKIADLSEIKFHSSRREAWLSAIKEADKYLEVVDGSVVGDSEVSIECVNVCKR